MTTNAELRAAAEYVLNPPLREIQHPGYTHEFESQTTFVGKSRQCASHILATVRDDERAAFEAWIAASPFEMDVTRWPADETKFAWPGSYEDINVDLAWCAWQASKGITVPSFIAK